jgi:hypothetical protein
MPASPRTGRICPWCWPVSWKARNVSSCCSVSRPWICALHPKFRRFLCKFFQYTVLGFLIVLLIIWIGMRYEQDKVRKMPDTKSLYTVPQVCAITYNASAVHIETLPDSSVVIQQNKTEHFNGTNTTSTFVAHCGQCGKCSNPHDVRIYDQTRNTLFEESIHCAKHGLVGGNRGASRCLRRRVGLTSGCNDCWADNIMCDLRLCLFSCFFHAIFAKGVHGGSSNETLNPCTQCDEVRCGPAFLKCAGANRRRTGIVTDIERTIHAEVCTSVQPKWWLNPDLQTVWQRLYGEPNVTRKERLQRIREKRKSKYNSTRI